MLSLLADATDEELAVIEGLGLSCRQNRADDAAPATWMEQRGLDRADIV